MKAMLAFARLAAALVIVALAVAGCESMNSLSKKIDYKSTGSAPGLELPPDLTAPAYDDR